MKILFHISIALAIGAPGPRISAQSTQFVSEKITVSVLGGFCTLDGVYSFKNQGPAAARWPIYYPLTNTGALPFPDSISVLDASTGKHLAFEKSGDGVLFPLDIPPEHTRRIRIRYSQRTPAAEFEYILTTTRAWGRPLERAEFKIVIPDSLRLTSCSPSFVAMEKTGRGTVYHITRTNFMPASNLHIQWKRRTP